MARFAAEPAPSRAAAGQLNNSKLDVRMPHPQIPRLTRKLGLAVVLMLGALGAQAQAPASVTTVTYMKPGVDVTKYNEFRIVPLNVSDTRVVPPPWVEKADPHQWNLTRQNRDFLQTSYASAVREGIESGGRYKVVNDAGPGTLQLETRLISLTPWASREEKGVETLGSGTLSFEANVRDARTGELLAAFQGNQPVGKDYQENTPMNKASDITEHFKTWGKNISQRLATAQAR
jgi:hypothetical protein